MVLLVVNASAFNDKQCLATLSCSYASLTFAAFLKLNNGPVVIIFLKSAHSKVAMGYGTIHGFLG